MDFKEFDEIKSDYILGKLSDSKQEEFVQFIAKNPKIISELDEFKLLLEELDNVNITKSSEERIDSRFHDFLKEEKVRYPIKKAPFIDWLTSLFNGNSLQSKLVYGFGILAIGIFIGKGFNSQSDIPTTNIDYAIAETEKVRSQLVLELIEQPSANKRLQAVNEAGKLNNATEQVIRALFITLNNDDNINVRIAAIESLMKYSKKPLVREGLIKSIANQDSPLVQISLADVMVSLQDKNSINPLKELIEQPDLDTSVKKKINESIQEII